MTDQGKSAPVSGNSLRLLGGGVAILVVYVALSAVTTIGDEGDIGGGLILILGLLFTAVGVIAVGKDLLSHRFRSR
jgi:hypothetical protein